jgi:hypothetical protein
LNPLNRRELEEMSEEYHKHSTHILKEGDQAKLDSDIHKLYSQLVLQMTDDLLEQADTQIDIAKKQAQPTPQPVQSYQETTNIKTDHSLKKPQLQWHQLIDNSYYPFIPLIRNKPHGLSDIPPSILDAQKEVSQNPNRMKNFALKDHKTQE